MTKKHMVRLLTADGGSCFEPKNKHHVVIKIEFKKTKIISQIKIQVLRRIHIVYIWRRIIMNVWSNATRTPITNAYTCISCSYVA